MFDIDTHLTEKEKEFISVNAFSLKYNKTNLDSENY